jgi:histidinol-phosphate aminotransferase
MDNKLLTGNKIRPEIRGLKPYKSPFFKYRIKLDLNESPFDIPAEVKEKIFDKMRSLLWQRYHDEFEEPLISSIGDYVGHPGQGILIGNGSNELIFHALLAVVRAERAVVYPEPSFSLYRQNVVVLGGKSAPFSLRLDDFSVEVDKVIELAGSLDAAAVVLCSPNNPTGGRTPNEDIEKICNSVDALVVVDEAYAQFAGDNAFELLERCPNLMLLRTFSKAFGLAGLRFGFALCAVEIAGEIRKIQLPHHVNFFTQVAALTMLENPTLIEERVAAIKQGREFLQKELSGITGLKPYPSEANFILAESEGITPEEVFDALLARGILVRNISNYPNLGRCLRITVGRPEENEELIVALKEVLG